MSWYKTDKTIPYLKFTIKHQHNSLHTTFASGNTVPSIQHQSYPHEYHTEHIKCSNYVVLPCVALTDISLFS